MIARIWHGKTSLKDFESYSEFLKRIAIPDYKRTKGFKGLSFLRSSVSTEGHFTLITYWENLEVIKNFAGENLKEQSTILRIEIFFWSLKSMCSTTRCLHQNNLNPNC